MNRTNAFSVALSLLAVGAVVSACTADTTPSDDSRSSAYDWEVLQGSETPTRDPNAEATDTSGEVGIASFTDGTQAAAGCRVVLNYCNTPWISPHPVATCRSTNCGCAHAKAVCASLVQQTCGTVIAYGNDCR